MIILRLALACVLLAFQFYFLIGIVLFAISDTRLGLKTGRCRHYGRPLRELPRGLVSDFRLVLTWPIKTRERFFG